jgi:uncharacterized repeat protein (TIGR04042 family)
MPETFIHTVWADGTELRCYSPSLVVEEYFTPGQSYPVADFVSRAREALTIGSERVRVKYGFGCGQAMAQLAHLEDLAVGADPTASVLVRGFAHTGEPR